MPIRERNLLSAAVLIAVTLFCYWGVVHNGFLTLDDRIYVTENTAVMAGLTWDGVVHIFTTVPFSYWQPLAFLSHMVDVQFLGTNAAAHHLMSVAWHCANAVMLFFALWRLTGAWYRSLLVAAIFALHPMHVEPVAWIASRKDLLSAFFFMAGLLAYTRRRFVWVCGAFALGLMAKPSIVGFPLVLLLLDFWPLQRRMRAAVIEKLPLFVLAALSVAITLSTISYSGQLTIDAHLHVEETPRIPRALTIVSEYLPKFFWPGHLSIFYIAGNAVVAGVVAVIGISIAATYFRERAPYAFVGWFWFLITLLPTTGLMMADRFSYLPFIGLSIAVVWGVSDIVARYRVLRLSASTAAAVVLVVLGTLCYQQVAIWRNSYTIFQQAIANNPDNYVARQWMGDTLAMDGRFGEAIYQYEEALRVHPNYFLVELNCARLYLQAGSEDDALRHFQAAIRLRPETPETYKEMGDVLLTQGNLQRAYVFFKKAQERHYPDKEKIDGLVLSVESALRR